MSGQVKQDSMTRAETVPVMKIEKDKKKKFKRFRTIGSTTSKSLSKFSSKLWDFASLKSELRSSPEEGGTTKKPFLSSKGDSSRKLKNVLNIVANEEARRQRFVRHVGDLGVYTAKHIALQLAMMLLNVNTNQILAEDNCDRKPDIDLDWKHTIDLHGRWAVTYVLVGDEKDSNGLPSTDAGVSRLLFLMEIAKESHNLGNLIAFRGITKGLCHVELSWLWDFAKQKHIKSMNSLRRRSKEAYEKVPEKNQRSLVMKQLLDKIRYVFATSKQAEIEEKTDDTNITEEASSVSQSVPQPQPEVECASSQENVNGSKSESEETVHKTQTESTKEEWVDILLSEEKREDLHSTLRSQIASARSANSLKLLSKVIQSKLNSSFVRTLQDSGLM